MAITMKITPLPPDYHYNPFVAPIYPNTQQQQLIAKTSGCCRYVYNTLLRDNSKKYNTYKTNLAQGIRSPKPKLSYPELCRRPLVGIIAHMSPLWSTAHGKAGS